MTRPLSTLPAIAVIALFAATAFSAPERGTPEEAKAMLMKAAAHYKEVGRTQALADFTASKAPFRDRDLYIVCVGPNRMLSANGAFPTYVGASIDVLKDASGKPLGGAIMHSVDAKSAGAVSYMMVNPTTGKSELKTLFTMKLGDDVCGVGAYTAT